VCFANFGDTGLLGGRRYLLFFKFQKLAMLLIYEIGINATPTFFVPGQNCPGLPACTVTELAILYVGGLPTVQSIIPPQASPYPRWVDPLW